MTATRSSSSRRASCEVEAGDTVDLTLQFDQGPVTGPVAIPAGKPTPKATVEVGGDGSGQVVVEGASYGAVAARERLSATLMSGTYEATKAGTAHRSRW